MSEKLSDICNLDDCGGYVCEFHSLRPETQEYIILLDAENTKLKTLNDSLTGIANPTCHSGHNDYPLTLWDCPVCVQIEKKKLSTCDLCDEPAEYRQCQGCMNDKLIGSHTDEEYQQLEAEIQRLRIRVLGDGIARVEALEGGNDEAPD